MLRAYYQLGLCLSGIPAPSVKPCRCSRNTSSIGKDPTNSKSPNSLIATLKK